MLGVEALTARYGSIAAVRDVDLCVDRGEIVALIGQNGAGKTTALRAIMGQHRDRDGRITVDGAAVGDGPIAACRSGIAIVPQGRRLFPSLSVAEHLDLAASRSRSASRHGAFTVDELLGYFPGLGRRLGVRAASLSGGEQQMLAVGRALLLGPRYVLMDEPTEGLAPTIVAAVADLLADLPGRDIGVVVTDQLVGPLARTATRRYTVDRGAITRCVVADGGDAERLGSGSSGDPARQSARPDQHRRLGEREGSR